MLADSKTCGKLLVGEVLEHEAEDVTGKPSGGKRATGMAADRLPMATGRATKSLWFDREVLRLEHASLWSDHASPSSDHAFWWMDHEHLWSEHASLLYRTTRPGVFIPVFRLRLSLAPHSGWENHQHG